MPMTQILLSTRTRLYQNDLLPLFLCSLYISLRDQYLIKHITFTSFCYKHSEDFEVENTWNLINYHSFSQSNMQEAARNQVDCHSPGREHQGVRERKVKELMVNKCRLVEVPYNASLAHTMNALLANRVVALPVAAPPGHWIGAGGSMIMETDKQTGAVRKHYIGMVTMLDILAHIGGVNDARGQMDGSDASDLDRKMSVEVSSIIGHCLEGLSLWTLNPSTR